MTANLLLEWSNGGLLPFPNLFLRYLNCIRTNLMLLSLQWLQERSPSTCLWVLSQWHSLYSGSPRRKEEHWKKFSSPSDKKVVFLFLFGTPPAGKIKPIYAVLPLQLIQEDTALQNSKYQYIKMSVPWSLLFEISLCCIFVIVILARFVQDSWSGYLIIWLVQKFRFDLRQNIIHSCSK